ncbi:hypothetical protein [Tropicimonas sediminicola]|uniref:Chalcone isomerase-like n=1 Tax=Tropicimonas sediminicola TaxID=1031541 RepID=A0A239D072_9RHOB|nr:hypothetical protein [Tropicimonas sediminicola]SNS25855.1 hypothetical protein SAMN05421757_101581 [Tropicimonas sediminicola]
MPRPLLLALLLAASQLAHVPVAEAAFAGARERGSAVYRYFGLPLYEARLFTPGGAPLDWNAPFGLELRYMRNLTQYDLVEGTMRELERTGGALPVRGKLETCFDAVSKGDRYLAVTQGPDRIAFFRNGQQTCTLAHPQITSRFMGIFLGENTRSSAFTRKLRGQ